MNETLFSNYHPRWQKKGADEQNYNHPRECMLYKARLSNQTITRNGLNSTCISKRTWHLQKWNKWNHYFSVSRKNISWPGTHNRTVPSKGMLIWWTFAQNNLMASCGMRNITYPTRGFAISMSFDVWILPHRHCTPLQNITQKML